MKIIYWFLFALITTLSASSLEADKMFWDEVKNSHRIELLELYKKQYPNGIFVPLADQKIKKLSKKKHKDQKSDQWNGSKTCDYAYCGMGYVYFNNNTLDQHQKSLAFKRAQRKLISSLEDNYSSDEIEKLKEFIQTQYFTDNKKRKYQVLRYIEQNDLP